jgi:hypothetical protein
MSITWRSRRESVAAGESGVMTQEDEGGRADRMPGAVLLKIQPC